MPLSCAPWDPLEGVPAENRLAKAIEVVRLWTGGELSYLPDSVKAEILATPLPLPNFPNGFDKWSSPEDATDPLSGGKIVEALGESSWEYDSSIGRFRLPGTDWTYDPNDNSFHSYGNAGAPVFTRHGPPPPPGYVTGMKTNPCGPD